MKFEFACGDGQEREGGRVTTNQPRVFPEDLLHLPRRLKPWWRARQVKLAHRRTTPEGDASSAPFGWIYSPAVTETAGFFLVHLGSPWNAALTFKKKSGRLPPRKKVALTSNFRQIQVTREEPRKKDERYDQYCRATFQISRSMARLPDHFFQDSSLARRWQEDSNS